MTRDHTHTHVWPIFFGMIPTNNIGHRKQMCPMIKKMWAVIASGCVNKKQDRQER